MQSKLKSLFIEKLAELATYKNFEGYLGREALGQKVQHGGSSYGPINISNALS